MKIVIFILFSLCSISLVAQPIVINPSTAKQNKIDQKALDNKYPGDPEVGLEIPHSIFFKIKEIYEKALGADIRQKLYFNTTLYFNDQGKIDHWNYRVDEQGRMVIIDSDKNTKSRLNADSIYRVVDVALPTLIDKFVSRRHVGKKGQLTVWTFIDATNPDPKEVAKQDSLMKKFFKENKGTERVVVKKDSVIKTLEEALAIKDTLRVKELMIESALLEAVPQVIYRFPNLELLSLANNDIEQVDINFKRLPKLNHLKLTGNILRNNSLQFTDNKSLKLLNLQSNLLSDIPDGVRNCKKLETLWLGRNEMSDLSNRSFRKLKQVKDINFYKAHIEALPQGIKKLKGLEVLDLYYNQLTSLPKTVTKLKKLTHLAVANNQLAELPTKVGKLKNLTNLYAHHNRLSKLPESISQLGNLQILDLGFNWFTDFPAEVTTFSQLKELDLSSNNFTEFPIQILSIKQLDKLFLRGNPFLSGDREVKYGQQFGQLKNKDIEVFY